MYFGRSQIHTPIPAAPESLGRLVDSIFGSRSTSAAELRRASCSRPLPPWRRCTRRWPTRAQRGLMTWRAQESEYKQSRHEHYAQLQQQMDRQYAELSQETAQRRAADASLGFQRDLGALPEVAPANAKARQTGSASSFHSPPLAQTQPLSEQGRANSWYPTVTHVY
ncbi:hypothetical protein DL89DRAFT_158655 [Linderina pennispora]|uniref:Uncharacterized protein n=1 Tax=Linderina pennispora TaxID=61395 RepID=A0A1Y1VU09_9FUNG|nr:uncharacterized protein DL89DRAFT_158655 [Linderina pennispora]ORX64772.1 hypothetical protein DL89DRAFT_158655 [Linderina pennispora]